MSRGIMELHLYDSEGNIEHKFSEQDVRGIISMVGLSGVEITEENVCDVIFSTLKKVADGDE
ncbi:hypothetical protein Q9251_02960 [Alkalihalobacillus macyae]|uniref:hypothetical protein n=1 Tax=Guptibacillus hwajinpoensis TaxID=208199 RepID=UPI00273BED41|nr:hypothetical protein [Alkalihalobacillus macyae]MDP4549835.1 hypothetical protein [Alkalihalobacillus macyae]